MRSHWTGIFLIGSVLACAVLLSFSIENFFVSSSPRNPSSSLKSDAIYGNLPLYFEPNQGQVDPQVKFISKGNGYTLFLTSKETILVLNRSNPDQHRSHLKRFLNHVQTLKSKAPTVLRFKLVGAN